MAASRPQDLVTHDQISRFRRSGWMVGGGLVTAADLHRLRQAVDQVLAAPQRYAYEAISLGAGAPSLPPGEGDAPQIWMSMLDGVWPDWAQSEVHARSHRLACALMGGPMELWYNQLLLKPPRIGPETYWHRDEAMPAAPERRMDGREDDDVGVILSIWIALDTTGTESGQMLYLDGGHVNDGVDLRRLPEVAPARVRAAPIEAGQATVHLGRTPHAATANRSGRWRRAWIQRFKRAGAEILHHPVV